MRTGLGISGRVPLLCALHSQSQPLARPGWWRKGPLGVWGSLLRPLPPPWRPLLRQGQRSEVWRSDGHVTKHHTAKPQKSFLPRHESTCVCGRAPPRAPGEGPSSLCELLRVSGVPWLRAMSLQGVLQASRGSCRCLCLLCPKASPSQHPRPLMGPPRPCRPQVSPKDPTPAGPRGALLPPWLRIPQLARLSCCPFHVGAWSQGTAETSVRACERAHLGRCQARGAGQTRAPGGRAHSPGVAGGAQVWQLAAASPHDLAGLPASTRCLP